MSQKRLNEELIAAAKKGDVLGVRKLLQASSTCSFTQCADIHASHDEALCEAAKYGHTEIVQLLLQPCSTCGFTRRANIHAYHDLALRRAALWGHAETVKVLLQEGANIHAQNDQALHWAAEGHTETVQVLLQAGADCSGIASRELKRFLTPRFIISSSDSVIIAIETSHIEIKERYKYSENLKSIERENSLGAKISLADFYYRPGGPGYYQAIMYD